MIRTAGLWALLFVLGLFPPGSSEPGAAWASPPGAALVRQVQQAELSSEPPPAPMEVVLPAEVPLTEPAPVPLDGTPRFLGQPDDDILGRICNQPVRSVSPLGGGASITLKMVFADGSKAALKPEQARVTKFASEVAAYRVARALMLGTVPPSCIRKFPKEVLYAGMPRSWQERMDAEMKVDKKGQVACAVIHWVPDLRGLALEKQTALWQPWLKRGGVVPPSKRRRALDISTMLLFDFLVVNDDRWSGGNTHTSGERMVYIDQGAGFGHDNNGRRNYVLSMLRGSQRFDRDIAESLFALDVPLLKKDLQELLPSSDLNDLGDRIEDARRYLRRLQEESPADSLLLGSEPP